MLFPEVRAAIVRLLFSVPRRRFHVRELARRSGLALSTVHQELHNLARLGVIGSSSNGYHRFYAANSQHAFFQPLSRIVEKSANLGSSGHDAGVYRRAKKRAPRKKRSLPRNLPTNWGLFRRHE